MKAKYIIAVFILGLLPHLGQAEVPFAAKVNGEIIPLASFERVLGDLKKKWQQESVEELTPEKENVLKISLRTVLDQLIEVELISQAAKDMGFSISEKEIREKINEVKKGFPSAKEFHRSLGEQGITLEDIEEGVKKQILSQKITDQLTKNIKISKRKIKQFFEHNRANFSRPEQIRVWRITAENEEEINEKLNQEPKVWEDLGYIERGELSKKSEKDVFSLKPNEISNIIKEKDGYHIYKAGEHLPAQETKLKSVRSLIENFLLQEKAQSIWERWLEDQREKAAIEYHPDLTWIVDD